MGAARWRAVRFWLVKYTVHGVQDSVVPHGGGLCPLATAVCRRLSAPRGKEEGGIGVRKREPRSQVSLPGE